MKTTKEERQDYLNELQVTYEDNINIQMIKDIDLLQAQNEIMKEALKECIILAHQINDNLPKVNYVSKQALQQVDALERNGE